MAVPCQLKSPLPPEVLRLQSVTARERISALGEAQLGLLSEKADLAPDDLLGKAVTLSIGLHDERKRHLHGYVTRFGQGGFEGKHHRYQMTVRPWLWLLTRTADCRIFQELTVPDIVKKVFQDHPIANYEFRLFRQYRSWLYCVQYRESDFNFVARLLEHEGICWYFEHADGAHKLVLTDSSSAHDTVPGYEELAFYGGQEQVALDEEFVRSWNLARQVRSGKFVITDYDFERPSTDLAVQQAVVRKYDLSDAEVFDYPGGYLQTNDGRQYVEDRIDEIQAGFETFSGSANALGLCAGRLLGLRRHPREDQNARYLLTATTLTLEQPVHESGDEVAAYRCDFEAMPAASQFRPPRRTPKPSIAGPQTATVTGPAGEEIFTDKYGRVKVKFPWDRDPEREARSSCWLSVSSAWAGSNFGAVHVPRIGQEVIVGFLEGDPDRPIVVGRAYNAENMPPWDLPANATQSGILSRSSKGGAYGNANAIRFEDKKGSEQLWLHAEKNQDIEVENDETHWVGHDRSKTIDHDETVHVKHDRTETVDNDETITIGVDRTEQVGNNESISIGVNRSESVGVNETISIGANRTETVGANETVSIGASRMVTVGASETATVALQRTHTVGANETIAIGAAQEVAIGAAQVVAVGAAQSISVGASQSTDVGADRSVRVGGAQATTVGKSRGITVGDNDSLKAGKNVVIDAGDSITLKTGSASITMKKDGTVQIKGKDILISGSGKINVKASGDVVVKGSKIGLN